MGLFSWIGSWFMKKPKPTTSAHSTAPAVVVAHPQDRALLVGINAYPGCPLNGCLFDIENMSSIARKREIGMYRKLLDANATTENILDSLKWLAETPSGARALFWYSGHGAQVPTDDKSESDGLAECMCPVDFDWSPERMIIDKQLVAVLGKMPPGVRFDWGSDSCHSGSLDRVISGRRKNHPRRYPIPDGMLGRIAQRHVQGHRVRAIQSKFRAMLGGRLDVGFVSGCRSDQTSADTEVNGQACGAFTWYFVQALNALPTNASLAEVVSKTRTLLAQEGYNQVPQVEGTQGNKPFLIY